MRLYLGIKIQIMILADYGNQLQLLLRQDMVHYLSFIQLLLQVAEK